MNRLIILYNKLYSISDKIRFLIVGGVNFSISYIIFVIAFKITGHESLSATLQWVLSSFISYLNQKFFVFGTKGNYLKEYLKCCSTWGIGYFINLVLLYILTKYFSLNTYIVQFFLMLWVSILTYILFKYFAFKVKR